MTLGTRDPVEIALLGTENDKPGNESVWGVFVLGWLYVGPFEAQGRHECPTP